jgi:hypothetical protein
MPLPGGPADKFGNLYEGLWTVRSMIEILHDRAISIRIEPLGAEGEGVEFWLQRRTEKREYHQVKRQHSDDGRWTLAILKSKGGLAHFRQKLRENDAASCVFVSAAWAYQLDELADRARRSASWPEFREACLNTERWVQDFETLCTYWDTCPEEAYEVLKRIEVETISERTLRREVECHLDSLVKRDSALTGGGDAATASDVLAQFALESVHHTVSAPDIWLRLAERGYRRCDWGRDPTVLTKVEEITRRYVYQLRQTLIAGNVILRGEVHTALQNLLSENTRQGVLLSAEAGRGKSGVLLQLVEAIHERGWPILAFRADQLNPVLDPVAIGKQLELPSSPVNVLAAIAQERDCVLVIDQIDAVSATSGRNSQFFECIEALLLQAQAYPRMRLLLACRTFDLENDHRLRSLVGKDGIATAISLGLLDQTTVKRIVQQLGLDADQLTQKQIALLAHPFHLSLLAGVAQTVPIKALSFQTAKELYYQFWDAKEAAVTRRLGYPVLWTQIMDLLVNIMSERQRLFVNEADIDQFRPAIRAMVSEHVLVQNAGQYAFFHESFFDYVFARRFAAQDRTLLSFLCESEQHLFRRAQVRQILLHERDIDHEDYLDDVRALLTTSSVRFHIKQIVHYLLAGLPNPTEEEWAILAPFLDSTDDPCSQEIWRQLQNAFPWFQLLDRLGLIERWLASDDDQRIERTVLLLTIAQRFTPDRVAALMAPYITEESWRLRFVVLLQHANLSTERRFFDLFLHCIDRGWLDETSEALASNRSLFWTLLFSLPSQQPEWACEAIGRYFKRCLIRSTVLGAAHPFDHELNLVPHTFHGDNTLVEAATHAPLAFYIHVFPFMCVVMGLNAQQEGNSPWRDSIWGRMRGQYGGGNGASDALLYAMERALAWVAADQPVEFERIALLLRSLDWETAHYLLLRGYTANGTYFADVAASYLSRHDSDLAIGYDGDAHKVTRELLEAITPHCSDQAFTQLEQRLLQYYTTYERSIKSYKSRVFFGQPTLFGYAQLQLLEGVIPSRRTSAMKRRIAEWRRKFPATDIAPPVQVGAVGSPISPSALAKMTNKQWLGALAHYQQDTLHVRSDGTVVGGAHTLAFQLEHLAKEDSHRFSALVQQFPDNTYPGYFDAVLRSIADTDLDLQSVLDVCKRCHALPNKPCGYWICTAIAKRAELPLPQEALEIVAWYAVEGIQVDRETWRTSLSESLDHHTDPIIAAGSASIRGHAAEAMAQLLFYDGTRLTFFLPSLERMVQDPSIPVRSCVALALRAVLKHDWDLALSLFFQLCQTEDVLLQARPVEQFLIAAAHTHFKIVLSLTQRMLQSTVPGVVRVGARVVCIASLITEQAQVLAQSCVVGREAQRMGAAEVFTTHLRLASFRTFCEQAIVQLLNDPSQKVCSLAATCFNEFDGGLLGDYERLVEAFIRSSTFDTNPYPLIHALENTTAKLPEITCLACEMFFEKLCMNGGNQPFVRPDAVGKLLLRIYSQQKEKVLQTRALNLMDRMLQLGEYSLSQVLAVYDR